MAKANQTRSESELAEEAKAEVAVQPKLEPELELQPEPELDTAEVVEVSRHPALTPALQPAALEPEPRSWLQSKLWYALAAGAAVALCAATLLIPASNPIGAKVVDARHGISNLVMNSVRSLRSRTLANHLTGATDLKLDGSHESAAKPDMESEPSSSPSQDFALANRNGVYPKEDLPPTPDEGNKLSTALKPRAGAGATVGAAAATGAAAMPGVKNDPGTMPANVAKTLSFPAGAPKMNPGTEGTPYNKPKVGGVPPPEPDVAERLPKYYGATGAAAGVTFGGAAANASIGGAAGAIGAAGLLVTNEAPQRLDHTPPGVGRSQQVNPYGQQQDAGVDECNPQFEDVNPAWVNAPKDPTYVTVPLDVTGPGEGGRGSTRRQTSYVKEVPPPPLPPHCLPKPPPPTRGGNGGSGGSS